MKGRRILALLILALLLGSTFTPALEYSFADSKKEETVKNDPRKKKGFCRDDDGKYKFFRNGKVDTSFTGVAKDNTTGKWFFVRKGYYDRTYTGIAKNPNNNCWFYVREGKLDWSKTGLVKRPENGNYYYVEKGKVNWDFTGMVLDEEKGLYFYVKRGMFQRDANGMYRMQDRKFYHVRNGRVMTKYSGFTTYKGENWYIKKGALDFNVSGKVEGEIDGVKATYVVSRGRVVGTPLSWPVDSGYITYGFGPRNGWEIAPGASNDHKGIDIAIYLNTPIHAAADGEVTFSDWGGGYGYLIAIEHENGIHTFYGHNNTLIAKVGTKVKRGDVVALSGSTGISSGPHTHFEVRDNGNPNDPMYFLENKELQPLPR